MTEQSSWGCRAEGDHYCVCVWDYTASITHTLTTQAFDLKEHISHNLKPRSLVHQTLDLPFKKNKLKKKKPTHMTLISDDIRFVSTAKQGQCSKRSHHRAHQIKAEHVRIKISTGQTKDVCLGEIRLFIREEFGLEKHWEWIIFSWKKGSGYENLLFLAGYTTWWSKWKREKNDAKSRKLPVSKSRCVIQKGLEPRVRLLNCVLKQGSD